MLFLRPVVWHPLKVPKLSKLHFPSFASQLAVQSILIPPTVPQCDVQECSMDFIIRISSCVTAQVSAPSSGTDITHVPKTLALLKLRFLKTSLLHICRRGMLSLVIRTHAHTWARSLELIKSHSCFNGENRTLCPHQRPFSAV